MREQDPAPSQECLYTGGNIYNTMIGIGALASLGLALPTGLAFGYGYGYGVRAGYNAYKQPSDEVKKLKLSANPVTGALGAGLQSAEERTGVTVAGIPMTSEPPLASESTKLEEDTSQPVKMLHSPLPGILPRPKSSFKDYSDYKAFVNGDEPYKTQSRQYMLRHKTLTSNKRR